MYMYYYIITCRYHGFISKADAIELLIDTKEGTYLVRKRSSGNYIVSFKYVVTSAFIHGWELVNFEN